MFAPLRAFLPTAYNGFFRRTHGRTNRLPPLPPTVPALGDPMRERLANGLAATIFIDLQSVSGLALILPEFMVSFRFKLIVDALHRISWMFIHVSDCSQILIGNMWKIFGNR